MMKKFEKQVEKKPTEQSVNPTYYDKTENWQRNDTIIKKFYKFHSLHLCYKD